MQTLTITIHFGKRKIELELWIKIATPLQNLINNAHILPSGILHLMSLVNKMRTIQEQNETGETWYLYEDMTDMLSKNYVQLLVGYVPSQALFSPIATNIVMYFIFCHFSYLQTQHIALSICSFNNP